MVVTLPAKLVDHPENVLHRNQGNAQDMFIWHGRGRGGCEYSTAFPHGALRPFLADDHSLDLRHDSRCMADWVPHLRWPAGQLRRVRRDHFGNQPQQLALQTFHVAEGVDEVGDFEKCRQVARHPANT